MPKLLFFVSEDHYFWSHRRIIAQTAYNKGWEIILVTQVNQYKEMILKAGFKLIPIKLSRSGMNPIKELKCLVRLYQIYRTEKPDIVHHVAMKPVLYGSFVSKLTRIKCVVNALAGLGYLFTSDKYTIRMFKFFINLAFRWLLNQNNSALIIQNEDDISLLSKNVVDKKRIFLIRGSGIDLQQFCVKPEPITDKPVICCATRMLKHKGIVELINAAKLLNKRGIKFILQLIGAPDFLNPSTITNDMLQEWNKEVFIEYLGFQNNIASFLQKSHVVALPSYREGLPKTLLEALACGKPIVTTDVPGCRDVVENGVNGFLVPPKDSVKLADALQLLIQDKDLREKMGKASRELAMDFRLEKIVDQTIQLYQRLLDANRD